MSPGSRNNPTRNHSVRLMALVALSATVLATVAGQSSADVASVSGSAFGASGTVTLGGTTQTLPPTPSVTLPPGGGSETASAASADVVFGTIPVFESGPLSVSTEGSTGPGGSVASSATVANVASGGLTVAEARSTCTASEAGISGSTTITGGIIVFDPDPAVIGEPGENIVIVPPNPAPNQEYTGPVLGTPDEYRIVFNEQVVTADAITVNAIHIYMLGPFATGDVIVGQSKCGIVATLAPPSLQVGDVSVTEPVAGTTTASFVVTLSAAPVSPVTVTYSTADGTASAADGDYTPASGVLTFNPGETSKTIEVEVLADAVSPEPDETFTLNLSDPIGATLGTASATATIVDTPPAAPFTYSCVTPSDADVTATSAVLSAVTDDPSITEATFTLFLDGTAVGSPIPVSGPSPFSAEVTGLLPDTTYTYTVTFDPGAQAQSGPACAFTTTAAPAAPVDPTDDEVPPATDQPGDTAAAPQAPGAAAVPAASAPSAASPSSPSAGSAPSSASSGSAGGATARGALARTGAFFSSELTAGLILVFAGLAVIGATRRPARRSSHSTSIRPSSLKRSFK